MMQVYFYHLISKTILCAIEANFKMQTDFIRFGAQYSYENTSYNQL